LTGIIFGFESFLHNAHGDACLCAMDAAYSTHEENASH